MTPFSLRIFVADGDPDGLRIVEKSNWIGKALVFPRALLPQVKARPELAQTGVYLLLGPRPDGEGDMLYVGEGDPIRPRLESHYAQKDFWTRAIGFTTTAGQLKGACAVFGIAPYCSGPRCQAHAAGQRQPACRAVAQRGGSG
jgi:hypothetical protein